MPAPNFGKLLEADLERVYSSIIRDNPGISHQDATNQATAKLLANRPNVPPPDGSCPVNDLPNELLAYIFQIGVDISDEDYEAFEDEDGDGDGDDDDDDDSTSEEEISEVVDADEEDGWEDEEDDDADDYDKDVDALLSVYMDAPFQILVSFVCRRWRDVSHDSPALWACIAVNQSSRVDLIQTWLTRSKGSPLTIEIDCQLSDDHLPEEEEYEYMNTSTDLITRAEQIERYPHQTDLLSRKELSLFLDLFIPHVARWKSFQVEVSFYSYMYIILERLAKAPPADILQDLQLHHYESGDEEGYFDSFHPIQLKTAFRLFEGSAPKLENVALWGVHLDWKGSLSMLSNLKELELSYHSMDVRPSYETFKAILDGSPHLDTLTFMTSGPSGPTEDWPSDDLLEYPSIRQLAVCYLDPEYLSQLFDRFSLPGVKDMALDLADADYTSFATQLTNPAPHRSKSLLSQLENMKIVNLPADNYSVHLMLGQLTNLKHINLNCLGEDENPFFELLMAPIGERMVVTSTGATMTISHPPSSSSKIDGQKYFCPNLKQLTIRGVEGDQLRRFITVRKNAGLPLTRLFVSEDDGLESDDEKWLKGNVEEFEYFEPSEDEGDDSDDIEEQFFSHQSD